ncbi:MAG: hypothetical protein HY360_16515 [Verrucomicrobia bacterium]|nr:hypothetical protein [Verrucomicrobiota bacterium]
MKKLIFRMMTFGILFGSAGGAGAESFLDESLAQIPSAAKSEHPERLRVVPGRLENEKALLVEDGAVSWPLKTKGTDLLIEFWFKPEAWDARSSAAVTLASFTFGNDTYRLEKPSHPAQLQLVRDQKPLQVYPIYNWFSQPWMNKNGRDMWHYVCLNLSNDELLLTVDGFAARVLARTKPAQPLSSIQLQGAPGTVFSSLHVVGSRAPTRFEIRNRYRAQYQGEPLLSKNTVTIPKLSRSPKLDGRLDPEEWAQAATLVGFTSLKRAPHALRAEPIMAWMGYDEKYLYLALRTPYQGTLDAKDWKGQFDMPLYGEESYEIFIHPPFTGVPDFCQLIGNPYSNQCDLKMLNLAWNGRWDWKASIQKDEWVAECRVEFKGSGMPVPKTGAVWTMNMVNTLADAGWCYAVAYNDSNSFGVVRFEESPPIIRPGPIQVEAETLRVPMELVGGRKSATLDVALEVFGPKDSLPFREVRKTIRLTPAATQHLDLVLPIKELEKGTLAVWVREEAHVLYHHHIGFPSAPPAIRQPAQPAAAPATVTAQAAPSSASPGPVSAEDQAVNRKWTAQELGQTLLDASKWQNHQLGLANDAPKPWTPMRVKDQTIECWGRSYVYRDSVLPLQVTSQGETLLAGVVRVVVTKNQKRFAFEKAAVSLKPIGDGLVQVEAVSRSGPYELRVTADYEFDGMAKIKLQLSSPDTLEAADGLSLEIPFQTARATLFHLTASSSGHPPASDSGFIPSEGKTLDEFRELIWLGDHTKGLCWFAESMENWPIKDEQAIQVITPARDETRTLRIKLADKPFSLERPLTLVFGIQATPTRPRPENFRSLAYLFSTQWCWFWGDGEYYPWQSHPQGAREQIQKARTNGQEVMPCSSLHFYGQYRFAKSLFGDLPNPGLMNREAMLWGPLWFATPLPTGLPQIPEKHTAPGNWYGKQYAPTGLGGYCPASDFQDYYLWRLQELIEQTGLGAIYLDQPVLRCSNAHHGCGYVNYKGQWTPRAPIFAMRNMIRRIHRLFHNAHGKAFIRWHSSNQILVPAVSFADVFWDGENYGSGPLRADEFYSKLLGEGRLQAQHTGFQFGFTPDLMPEFNPRYAPTPDSVRDIFGLLMVHDCTVCPAHSAHDQLIAFLHSKRLSFDFAGARTLHYWDNDPRIRVAPAAVKAIFHYNPKGAILGLFNWSDDVTETEVRLDLKGLDLGGNLTARDVISEAELPLQEGRLTVSILPRDLRLIRIERK